MLIVIEGLDGAGKSTQVKRLKQYLEAKRPLKYIHFPRYDASVYGGLISEFLQGGFGDINEVHPKLVALLFAEDRRDAFANMSKEDLDNNIILLDRYVNSNIAYQCAKLGDDIQRENLCKWIIETEYNCNKLPKPTLNIFLDVPMNFVASSLSSSRNGDDRNYLYGQKDIHESNIDFQKEVRKMYLNQAQLDKNFIVVNCSDEFGEMLPPDDIFNKIKTIVDKVII